MRAYSACKSMRIANVVCFAVVFPFVVVKQIQRRWGKPSAYIDTACTFPKEGLKDAWCIIIIIIIIIIVSFTAKIDKEI